MGQPGTPLVALPGWSFFGSFFRLPCRRGRQRPLDETQPFVARFRLRRRLASGHQGLPERSTGRTDVHDDRFLAFDGGFFEDVAFLLRR